MPLRRRSTYAVLLYLLSGLPLGVAYLVLLVSGYATALGLTITLVGIPMLLGMAYLVIGIAGLERRLARVLLGVEVVAARRPLRGGLLARLGGWMRDGAAWRELAYAALRATLGVAIGIGVATALSVVLQLVAYPTYYWASDEIVLGDVRLDTPGAAALACLAGLVLIPVVAWLVVGLGALSRRVATGLLGRVPGRALPERRARRIAARRALVLHASLAGALVVVMIGVWGLATPDGYFWPAWVALGLSIPLAVHAAVVLVPRPDGHGELVRPLPLVAALAALVFLETVAIWALTTPDGYFWPAWVALGLAVPVGGYVLVALFASRGDEELTERVQVLTETRAAAVDAQGAELRRIERDLHDGAQARLTALAMDLGMAREKLDSDPESASLLVAEAHQEAKRALTDLRDLARGIHPAVLSDRGLDAAVSALASGGGLPVDVDVDTGGRLPAPVEAAAYFVVAECIANARKHSGATRATARIARRGPVLVVEVADDGVGGADPGGSGLDGLRRRVEALDGRLLVVDEDGEGTRVQAEMPCGS
jgi:signal transduction histidine kinase